MLDQHQALHFTGIGGAGMSGLAEIMHQLGYAVRGSDLRLTPVTERLEKLGIQVVQGHAAANLQPGLTALVITSAVDESNPELVEARRRGLFVARAEPDIRQWMDLAALGAICDVTQLTGQAAYILALLEQGDPRFSDVSSRIFGTPHDVAAGKHARHGRHHGGGADAQRAGFGHRQLGRGEFHRQIFRIEAERLDDEIGLEDKIGALDFFRRFAPRRIGHAETLAHHAHAFHRLKPEKRFG